MYLKDIHIPIAYFFKYIEALTSKEKWLFFLLFTLLIIIARALAHM
jgi:hypothetical protein